MENLRTHGGYCQQTASSPVFCPEVFRGHSIRVTSHLPSASTSSPKIIWWFYRSFFQKMYYFYTQDRCRMQDPPKSGGVLFCIFKDVKRSPWFFALSCFTADGGTGPAHQARCLGNQANSPTSHSVPPHFRNKTAFGFPSSPSCCFIVFVDSTQRILSGSHLASRSPDPRAAFPVTPHIPAEGTGTALPGDRGLGRQIQAPLPNPALVLPSPELEGRLRGADQ